MLRENRKYRKAIRRQILSHAEEVSSQFGKSFGDERSESHISERQHTYVGQRKLYKDETDIHSLSERSAEMNG